MFFKRNIEHEKICTMKSIRIIVFVFLSTITFSLFSLGGEVPGKVVSVIDGNTIEFLSSDNETFRFVLSGIDCPELGQEFGEEAKKHLEKLLKGREIILTIEGKDRLGNKMGSITLPRGKDPRMELLENGLAWTQERNSNREFEVIQEEAKKKRKGLWKQENPVAPWVFRRQQSMQSPKGG